MNIQQYPKSILDQINEWIKWTWYKVSSDIQIEYKEWDNIVKFSITNQW